MSFLGKPIFFYLIYEIDFLKPTRTRIRTCLNPESTKLTVKNDGMKKNYIYYLSLLCFLILSKLNGQELNATVQLDADVRFQTVTGYGGFVCSPQFAYNHMTPAQIRQLWGADSELGYNIMRLYIPIGRSNWPQSLATAQLAQSLGLIIFASPWSMPADWKTNGDIAGIVTDANGNEIEGFLKEENYGDYADYLNDYVLYLRDNGVDLDGISLQNEPDYKVTYAGCSWTPQQMANFIKDYGDRIDCKIIAPETVGISTRYAQALAADGVKEQFDIFAGHQYGAIETEGIALQRSQAKEAWMTEFLINWNAGSQTPRDYSWEQDAFNFARSINTAMLSNVSAWVHYASKRYYGMMGDGERGTQEGVITKRGYILSHFAKYTTGKSRIAATWLDDSEELEGSAFISEDGNTLTLHLINASANTYNLTTDLPFYTESGTRIVTTNAESMATTEVSLSSESFRPQVNIEPSSFTTFVFEKSSERPESQMTGSPVYYNPIENQNPTQAAFGNGYELSNRQMTFSVNNRLISSNTALTNGYLALDDRYTKLVFQVKHVVSANQYNSDNTTLHYVNAEGQLSSYNYGRIDMPATGNFEWEFDLSREVLSDGITGIVGISNTNYSSVLTIDFGAVYFLLGNEKAYAFEGIYSKEDSDLLEALSNADYTVINFSKTTEVPENPNWKAQAENPNLLFYTAENSGIKETNVVAGTQAAQLELEGKGNFQVPESFTAAQASYTRDFTGYELLILPFEASIPEGADCYTIEPAADEIACKLITEAVIPSNTPVLVLGTGRFTFTGSGAASTPKLNTTNNINGVYIKNQAAAGAYTLVVENEDPVFKQVAAGTAQPVNPFTAYLSESAGYTAARIAVRFDKLSLAAVDSSAGFFKVYPNPATDVLRLQLDETTASQAIIYDLQGRNVLGPLDVSQTRSIPVSSLNPGVYLIRVSNGEQSSTLRFIKG